ncbi:hypothetical protein BN946_scf184989.g58 [Trametes cinnabarina]|uniref:Protein kinase domain-containing protein n=1 Tax=Pycnoporus cinnabarinus TaxID=5643 RepID=A0A060S350_PYCCI|nr:hypothetical protein BN946_scf184989.g58 [Trametes cinnabarina]
MATSSKQNSRFSSLKVFKFAAGPKPPPLPPKDPFRLPNPSLPSLGNSLSPDSFSSQPATPLSAQYATLLRSPSPSPSYAPSSYAPSSHTTLSPPSSTSPESAGSRRGLFKFSSFSRRPKTPKTAESGYSAASESSQPSESADDPSISLPWNFQHNIHVDEGFVGLPPTWAASLADAGFSEEEIAAIQAKRAESRSRSARSIYSLNPSRSASPASTTRYPGRTPPISRPPPTHAFTYPQLHSQSTPHLPTHHHGGSATRLTPPIPPPPTISVVSSDSSSNSALSEKQLLARSAPQRSFHVANESIDTVSHSPPPAYTSPKKESQLSRPDEDFRLPPSIEQPMAGRSPRPDDSTELSTESSSSGSHEQHTTSPVLPVPPRLSFHQDDLSSWTESLFSSIPSSITLTPPKPAPTRMFTSPSKQGTGGSSASPPRATPVRGRNDSPSPATRQLPPQKPLPKQETPPVTAPTGALPPPPTESRSLLRHEAAGMIASANSSGVSVSSATRDSSVEMADVSTDSQWSSSTLLTPVLDEFPSIPHITTAEQLDLQMSLARDKENRDSGLSTVTVTPATIATAAIARSARGNVVVSPVLTDGDGLTHIKPVAQDPDDTRPHSPNSTESHSSASSSSTSGSLSMSTGTESASSDSRPQTLTASETQDWRPTGGKPKSIEYLDSPEPSPRVASFAERDVFTVSVTGTQDEPPDTAGTRRPSIIIDHYLSVTPTDGRPRTPISPASTSSPSPLSPAPRYPGWLSAVVAPLKSFINDQVDPRELFADLREIAEGESGSVYAARVLATSHSLEQHSSTFVAIKNVPILPSGSPKIDDLRRELTLMKGVSHVHILTMDELYVDLVEDSLWICMDLMERSLADIIAYADEGILFHEKSIARVAGDVLHALDYLQTKGIAHRDLRSDNLLVNLQGVVKLADFSNAVQVTRDNPIRTELAGVAYWQAPEIRSGSYNALKVDVWSLGATIWELAQAEPPFSDIADPKEFGDELPALSQPEIYSRSFHDFLLLCSKPSSSRPDPHELLSTPFIRNPSGRQAIIDLLADCRAIEERMSRRHSADSTGTVSRSGS